MHLLQPSSHPTHPHPDPHSPPPLTPTPTHTAPFRSPATCCVPLQLSERLAEFLSGAAAAAAEEGGTAGGAAELPQVEHAPGFERYKASGLGLSGTKLGEGGL